MSPVISSMGVGNKPLTSGRLFTDIEKSQYVLWQRLCAVSLKNVKIRRVKVLYSDELPVKPVADPGNDEQYLNRKRFRLEALPLYPLSPV